MASPNDIVELVLTCGSWQEAQRIVDQLFEKQLIVCAEFIPIKAKRTWKRHLEETEEIKLIMLSLNDYFKKVEHEVKQLHSYESFVLQALPVTQLSHQAHAW